MRLSWTERLTTPLVGAAIALTAGMMLGGAMRPNFSGDGRPAGPQMIAGWAGGRSTGPSDEGAALASYGGRVPDYVLGADWKKAMAWPEEPATSPESKPRAARSAEAPTYEPVGLTRADDDGSDPAPHGRYPSLGADDPAAAPHAPTGQAVDDADDAPATG